MHRPPDIMPQAAIVAAIAILVMAWFAFIAPARGEEARLAPGLYLMPVFYLSDGSRIADTGYARPQPDIETCGERMRFAARQPAPPGVSAITWLCFRVRAGRPI